MSRTWALATTVAALLLASPAAAQEGPVSLHGRHAIRLGVGVVDVSSSVTTSLPEGARVSSSVAFSGFLGYRFWYHPDWAFQVDAGAMEVSSDISSSFQGARVSSSTVSAVLAGIRWQPTALALGRTGRPFLELTPGIVAGTTSEVLSNPPTVSAETQSVPALRAGLGVDWVLSRRIALGVTGHYLWTGDFDRPVAGHERMNSFDLEFGFGVLLGGGR